MKKSCNNIDLSKGVQEYLEKNPGKYRLCTMCSGPELISISQYGDYRKSSDIIFEFNGSTIYFSKTQYDMGLRKITDNMVNGLYQKSWRCHLK